MGTSDELPRLGPFALERRIGRGGMGAVWAARHLQGMAVAIKVLEERGERHAAALRREVRAAAALDHPGIIRLFDQGEVPEGSPLPAGSPWVAMELAEGTLRGAGPRDWAGVRDLALAVLDALAHAHGRGVIHRDLKPDNLLRLPEAAVPWVLADFGLARAGYRDGEGVGPVVGTPAYMPPEQVAGDWRAEGPATDLYALACVIWELVYGEPPFGRRDREEIVRGHLYREPPSRPPVLAVPPETERWLRAMLAKKPRERPQSAAHAVASLMALGDPDLQFTPVIQPRRQSWSPSTIVLGARLEEELQGSAALGEAARLPCPDDWRVVAPLVSSPPSEAGLRLFSLRVPRVVGRERERDQLWAALAEVARTRRTRWLALEGPPGSGARRLAGWVAERAVELGQAAAIRQRRGIPLEVALRHRLRLQGLDVDRTGAALGALGVPESFERELMARTLCGEVEEWPAAQVDAVLAGLIGQLAALTPLVLVLEDPRPGLARALVQRRVPVLLIEVGPAVEGAERMALGPLTEDQMNELVHDALGLDPALAARVAERAAGNPGLVQRLVRAWIDEGALVASPHGFRLAPGASEALPEDLASHWIRAGERWIARRSEADQRALEVAAILGTRVERAVWERTLAALELAPSPSLVEALADAGLASVRPDGDWVWQHPALVESVVARVGDPRPIHRAAAAATDDPHQRANHLLAAEPGLEAAEALVRSAKAHHVRGRMALAALRMDQWTELVERLGLRAPDERLIPGIVHRSAVRRILGHDGVGEDAVRDALTWVRDRRLRGLVLGELAAILGTRGFPDEAAPLHREARAIALELGDLHRWASTAQGAALLRIDAERYEEALEVVDEVLATEGIAPRIRSQILRLRSTACLRLGRTADAAEALDEAIPLARQIGHVRILGSLTNDLGMVHVAEGRLDEGEQCFREAVAAYRLAGTGGEVVARLNLALLEDRRGRYQAARRELEHLVHQPRVHGNPPLWLLVRLALLKVDAALGDWEGVEARLDALAELAEGVGQAWTRSKLDQVDDAIERAKAAGREELLDRLAALRRVLEA